LFVHRLSKIQFVSRSTCLSPTGGVCSRSNNTIKNKSAIIQRLQSNVNRNTANKILTSRPVKPKLLVNMRTFIGANGVPLSTNASQTFFNKVEKFLPYFTDNEFDQVDKILVAIEKRTTQNNKNTVFRYIRNLRRNIMNARSNPYKQITPNGNARANATPRNATPNGNVRVNATPKGNVNMSNANNGNQRGVKRQRTN